MDKDLKKYKKQAMEIINDANNMINSMVETLSGDDPVSSFQSRDADSAFDRMRYVQNDAVHLFHYCNSVDDYKHVAEGKEHVEFMKKQARHRLLRMKEGLESIESYTQEAVKCQADNSNERE